MHVVSGIAKGRRLKRPGVHVRPTAQRVKAALFDVLGDHVVGARVLDLFAGSGALGLEALSRGAKEAVFVDINPVAVQTIRQNLQSLGLEQKAQVWQDDWASALRRLAATRRAFDLVFSDPPYEPQITTDVLSELDSAAILSEHGVLVTECPKREALPEKTGSFVSIRVKSYGDTQLGFWRSTHNLPA